MYKISICIFYVVLFVVEISHSQQDAQYTQYMYNTVTINPAYAGSRGTLSFVGLHRSQWIRIEGAPLTQTFSVNLPLGSLRFMEDAPGLGLSVVNDNIGPLQETHLNIDYSYPIAISDEGILRFGLKLSGQFLSLDLNKLNAFNVADPVFFNSDNNDFIPNVGVGLYYYDTHFYAGLSTPGLLSRNYFKTDDDALLISKERMHYYFITGYVFNMSRRLKFKPALLSKMVFGSPLQADVSASFKYDEKLILGLAYRWSAAVSALAGFQVSKSVMIGFSYDMETTAIGNGNEFNHGSYELLLRFELAKKGNLRRQWNPRFF
ncbi:type IX secretion system membrane protein PorP/SprF [Flavivirga sp. 57AJ16]|uniref:PorP/SprF family type IX secretion system membrane protein n=1 Tax=Flavivirga sp. 57AJ16 TaxID=3025307 RepID=UPI002365F9C4|nr:type IX secretion system membrane protein PorP/SprF [Flavivirga sp. 57AJ16]MDD7887969.1 type IX secretion system membrane protein PorP/SprF [Flavivirga sp. 57AJ16]